MVPAGLALLGGSARDPFTVLVRLVTSWVTGALARWALTRQGHSRVVARRWGDEGMNPDRVIWSMVAFGVWVIVDRMQAATSPAGEWFNWCLVVFHGPVWLFGVAGP